MYLCDACAAAMVIAKKLLPSSKLFPPNEAPWAKCKCGKCGTETNCTFFPERGLINGGTFDEI